MTSSPRHRTQLKSFSLSTRICKFLVTNTRWDKERKNLSVLKSSLIMCKYSPGEQMKYDPGWKGPLDKRSCTDCFWLILFVLFLTGWSSVAYYGTYDFSHCKHRVFVNTDTQRGFLSPAPSTSMRYYFTQPEYSDFFFFFSRVKD